MKVLVVGNMYPPHYLGGYELFCHDVVRRWRERGHEVTVLTSDVRIPGVADLPGERAAGVRRDLGLYWDDHELLSPPLRQRLAHERRNQAALAAALAESRPDVVSFWNMGTMSLGLLTAVAELGIPMVCYLADDWLDYGPRLDAWLRLFRRRPWLAALVRRRTGVPTTLPDLPAVSAFCFCSERTRRWAEERTAWRFPDAGIVPCGLADDDFPVVPRAVATPWRGRLLCVGRLDPRKGFDVAVRALPRLPGMTLELVGRGSADQRAALQAVASECGVADRVRISEARREDLREVYAGSDATLFTSLWDEPWGLVPIESMACGTPVVAAASGGAVEFLDDGRNALVIAKGDPAVLAAAVQRLADDATLRQRLVDGGRETALRMSARRLADELERWHLGAAQGDRSGRWQPAVGAREP